MASPATKTQTDRVNRSPQMNVHNDGAARTVDIVVVHFNAPDALAGCIAPLTQELGSGGTLSLAVIDNDVEQPAAAIERELAQLEAASYEQMSENTGFGTASNVGAQKGTAEFLLFLNPDCVITPDSIDTLVRTLNSNPEMVAVGPQIVRPSGEPEISWAHHPGLIWEARRRRLWRALKAGKTWARAQAKQMIATPRDVEWLTAACLMVRRDAFESVKGFDEEFFLYFEDADLGLRLGQHGKLRFEPTASARHTGGASSNSNDTNALHHYRASQNLYYVKHRPLWERLGLRLWRIFKP